MAVTPWWEHLKLRDEIVKSQGNVNDVQMSLFRAAYKPASVLYSDVDYYSSITYPTAGLIELLAKTAVRLGVPGDTSVKPVWRGDQAMGGGKSHGLVGLYHLAKNAGEFRNTELGERVWAEAEKITGGVIPDDLRKPIVAVLSCDELSPFTYDKDQDGIAETFAERWLWRVVEEDTKKFKEYRANLETKEGIVEILTDIGRPVLTLVDEILDYVQKATVEGEAKAGNEVPVFTRMLFEAVTRCPDAEVVVVMISSETDKVSLTGPGEVIREDLEGQMTKFASITTTTTGADFASIIRRRLFANDPDPTVVAGVAKLFEDTVKNSSPGTWTPQFSEHIWWKNGAWHKEVARCYPFHPDIMNMVGGDWARIAGFQKVRSTIQIFAATVWHLYQRGKAGDWAPQLIGMGDLPLSDAPTREAITNSGVIADQTAMANWREIAISDVVNNEDDGGSARLLDLNRPADLFTAANPRVAERMACVIFLTSLTPRAHGVIGATDPEMACAAFVPDPACSLPLVESVRQQLEDPQEGLATIEPLPGKGGNPRRLKLSTKQTVQMLIREQRNSVLDEDRDARIRTLTESEMTSGPFDRVQFVSAEDLDLSTLDKGEALTKALVECLGNAGLDSATTTRLVVLDPYAFTLMNGQDAETRMALSAALGVPAPTGHSGWWPAPMPVAWPSSMVFGVVNTQRRKALRSAVTDLVALERVVQLPTVADDESNKSAVEQDIKEARKRAIDRLRKAFQHMVFLNEGAPDGDGNRPKVAEDQKAESDSHSALDGTHVWTYLANKHARAYQQGELDKDALVHLLNRNGGKEWGTALKTLRDKFYKSPRFPLLWDGQITLQRAIYDALQSGDARVLTAAGDEAHATKAEEVNLGNNNQLHKPAAADVTVPEFVGLEIELAEALADKDGIQIQISGSGAIQSQSVPPGDLYVAGHVIVLDATSGPGPTPPPPPPPASTEQKLVFSIPALTFTDPERAEQMFQVFTKLAEACEAEQEGAASYLTAQVQLTAGTDQIAKIVDRLGDAGVSYNLSDV